MVCSCAAIKQLQQKSSCSKMASSIDVKGLSIEELASFLRDNSVSEEAIALFRDNKVSGQALLLVDDGELKELMPTIGDRAIVRNLLSKIKKVTGLLCHSVTHYFSVAYGEPKIRKEKEAISTGKEMEAVMPRKDIESQFESDNVRMLLLFLIRLLSSAGRNVGLF